MSEGGKEGSGPERLLWERERVVREEGREGMEPVRLLWERERVVREVRFPKVMGMVPVRLL